VEQDGHVAVLAPLLSGTTEQIADALAALRSISSRLSCDHEQSCDTRSGPPLVGWVVHGSVRKYLIRASGQRRIVDPLMLGDFFGFY
jgi:hypothetical protein